MKNLFLLLSCLVVLTACGEPSKLVKQEKNPQGVTTNEKKAVSNDLLKPQSTEESKETK